MARRDIRDFYGKILGYYYKDEDKTRNFYDQIACSGDGTQGLIMMDSNGGGQ